MERDGEILRAAIANIIFPVGWKPEDPYGIVSTAMVARFRKRWAVPGIAECELALTPEEEKALIKSFIIL